MTFDERLECLFRSTESLHASAKELHAIAQEHTRQLPEQTKQLQLDAENIRSLARIAEAHEHRINDLEGGIDPRMTAQAARLNPDTANNPCVRAPH